MAWKRTGTLLLWLLLLAGVAVSAWGPRAAEAVGSRGPLEGEPTGLILVGAIDPAELPAPSLTETVGPVKKFLHNGDLSAEKIQAAALAPGDGVAMAETSEGPAPAAGSGFAGIGIDSGQTPCRCPAANGGVAEGNGYLVVAVDAAFQVWDPSGVSRLGPADLPLFFSGCYDAEGYSRLSDAFVDFDAGASRFIMGALAYDASFNSRLCIAATETDDPTGKWWVYFVDIDRPDNGQGLLDFARLAIGSDALYVSGNQYAYDPAAPVFEDRFSYLGPRLYAFRKSLLYEGLGDPFGGVHHDLDVTNQETLFPVRGVDIDGRMYFVASDTVCPCSQAGLWQWDDPFGADALGFKGLAALLTFTQPPDAIQPDGGSLISTNDGRVTGAFWTDADGDPTIYAVHTVGCNPGGSAVACVHWFQLGNLEDTPVLVAQGTIAGESEYRFQPSIAVNEAGQAAVAYTFSSATEYAGIRATDIGSGAELTLKAGLGVIASGSENGAAAVVVAGNGCNLLAFGEFANSEQAWDTWVSSLVYDDCLGEPEPEPLPPAAPIKTFLPPPPFGQRPTQTGTQTPTSTPTSTAANHASTGRTPSPTRTATVTPTPSLSPTPTAVATPDAPETPEPGETVTPVPKITPVPTRAPSNPPAVTATSTSTLTPTPKASGSPPPTATATPVQASTATEYLSNTKISGSCGSYQLSAAAPVGATTVSIGKSGAVTWTNKPTNVGTLDAGVYLLTLKRSNSGPNGPLVVSIEVGYCDNGAKFVALSPFPVTGTISKNGSMTLTSINPGRHLGTGELPAVRVTNTDSNNALDLTTSGGSFLTGPIY